MSSEFLAATPKRSPILGASVIANGVLTVGLVVVGVLYFQTTTELAATKADLAKEVARAAGLKANLNSTRTELQSLAAQATKLKSELEREKARLPAVPVRVEFRRSVMGQGLVGIFSNYSAKQIPVVIALHNPTTGQRKQLSIQIAPGSMDEIGYLEGWQFASGDQIAIRSADMRHCESLYRRSTANLAPQADAREPIRSKRQHYAPPLMPGLGL